MTDEEKLVEFEVIIRFRSRELTTMGEAIHYVEECLDDPCHDFEVRAKGMEVIN
jgi:hypothetical protein